MQFRIADTFTESLARLPGEEQRAAKTTAFDLQLDPARPGMRFHRVEGARDRNFWSVRVSRGLRMIVHKTAADLLLCYVGEHDAAYRWAERRRIERHPNTGAAQLVEVREVVRDVAVPRYVAAEEAARPVFSGIADDRLLRLRRSRRVAGRRPAGHRRGCAAGAGRSSAGGGRRGAAGAGHRRHAGAAGPRGRGYRPVRPSRRAAPLPGDGQSRGTAARP